MNKCDAKDDITLKDVELSKNLILAYQIFSMNGRKIITGTKELTTANVVKYIKSLVDLVYGNLLNGMLIKCTHQAILNAMSLLGLDE